MTQIVYERSRGLQDVETHYCPGCHHGIIHKLIAEVLVEMDLLDRTVGISPVGCSVLAGNYLNCDFIEAAHGRAPAVATGIKRTRPDLLVLHLPGRRRPGLHRRGRNRARGDARGKRTPPVFINNAIYGMTGGQMAPTTLIGQKSTTSQSGRTQAQHGMPIRMAEMLSTLDGMAYAERVCVADIPSLNKAKRAIKKAFTLQQQGIGHTFVEFLSTCPTNWGMTPVAAGEWVKSDMARYYPLGVKKDVEAAK